MYDLLYSMDGLRVVRLDDVLHSIDILITATGVSLPLPLPLPLPLSLSLSLILIIVVLLLDGTNCLFRDLTVVAHSTSHERHLVL